MSNDKVAVQKERLEAMCVGPEWTSLLVAEGKTLPIFGLKETEATKPLLANFYREQYMEAGWALVMQEEPEAYMDIEFFSPVQCHLSLRFSLRDEEVLRTLIDNGGMFGLAATQEAIRRFEVIVIDDMYLDIPALLVNAPL